MPARPAIQTATGFHQKTYSSSDYAIPDPADVLAYPKRPDDQIRIQVISNARRQIDSFFHQVDHPIFQLEVNIYPKMTPKN